MKRKYLLRIVLMLISTVPLLAATTNLGAVAVMIKEWEVPTPNSRPHDPALGLDGSLWYTGQLSNTLGRLDRKRGMIREYRLKTPDSGPHGLVADKEGSIWFTANYKGFIGKLNPGTGRVTEYPIPDPAARDPHAPVFDHKGILWFTVERGNFVGRLDPLTGAIRLKPSPTANSIPYGIAVNSKGVPFFCDFGTNKLASINPDTMEITEYILPRGARPRRLTLTINDMLYYSDYARGYLGRLDLETDKTEEWASPGGPKSNRTVSQRRPTE